VTTYVAVGVIGMALEPTAVLVEVILRAVVEGAEASKTAD